MLTMLSKFSVHRPICGLFGINMTCRMQPVMEVAIRVSLQ